MCKVDAGGKVTHSAVCQPDLISGFGATATGILFRNPKEPTWTIPEIRPIPGLRESK